MRRIYMDYNATCPIRAEVIASVSAAMAVTGNASSIHGDGRAARKLVEDARAEVASLVNVRSAQVIFNSGATEGNNTILSGYQDKVVFVSSIEHPSVLEAAQHARQIPVTREGLIDTKKFVGMLEHETPALVSIQYVNSETGVIQTISELATLAKSKGVLVHCDAVQAAGRIDIDFKQLNVDYLTLSAHKFGGPQGVGALVFREGLQMPKFMRGGGQEKRQRAGTENVAAIAGFGTAARIAKDSIRTYQTNCNTLRRKLEQGLRSVANDLVIIAESAPRVANTVSVAIPGVSAETQLMAMDLEGISVSSGSACSSGTFKPSHVLTAMGYSEDDAKSALRFSIGYATTDPEIDAAIAAYGSTVARIKR